MSPFTRIVFCALVAACGMPSPTVETTSASVASFQQYRTFSFQLPHAAPGGFDVSPRTIDVQNRLTAVVGKALTDKGYVSVPDHGDLIIVVAAGEATKEETRQLTRRAAAVAGDRDETIEVPEGSLVIEAFDPTKHERVWRSAATGEVRSEGIDETRLNSVVGTMLASFPAATRR
jgi:hypothetical protein